MPKLTKKTLIPISLLIPIIVGIVWVSSLKAKTEENETNINKLEARYENDIREIKTDIKELLSRKCK